VTFSRRHSDVGQVTGLTAAFSSQEYEAAWHLQRD
jgi:hypothetical protein